MVVQQAAWSSSQIVEHCAPEDQVVGLQQGEHNGTQAQHRNHLGLTEGSGLMWASTRNAAPGHHITGKDQIEYLRLSLKHQCASIELSKVELNKIEWTEFLQAHNDITLKVKRKFDRIYINYNLPFVNFFS